MALHRLLKKTGPSSVENTTDEKTNLKYVFPQIVASAVSSLYHLVAGVSLGHMVLELYHIGTSDKLTTDILEIVVALVSLAVGGVVCGFLIDTKGRLKTIRLAAVPAITGCLILAISQQLWILIVGTLFTGIAIACGTFPSVVYTTEIAHPDLRGSLLSLGPAFSVFGIIVSYLASLTTRTTLIIMGIVYFVVASTAVFYIPESPVWLICKKRDDQAKKSLEWFDKHQPPLTATRSYAQHHFERLLEERHALPSSNGFCKDTRRPEFYRPLLILSGFFFLQQLSAISILIAYYVGNTFKNFEPHMFGFEFAAICVGLLATTSIVNFFLLRVFRRRALVVCGSVVVTVCFFGHAMVVMFAAEGTHRISVGIIFSCLGVLMMVLPVPWTMVAELFPSRIRGVAYCMVCSLVYSMIFLSAFILYLVTELILNENLAWFFLWTLTVLIVMSVYGYVFLPVTHRTKLFDVQIYFQHYNTYVMWAKARKRENREQREELPME